MSERKVGIKWIFAVVYFFCCIYLHTRKNIGWNGTTAVASLMLHFSLQSQSNAMNCDQAVFMRKQALNHKQTDKWLVLLLERKQNIIAPLHLIQGARAAPFQPILCTDLVARLFYEPKTSSLDSQQLPLSIDSPSFQLFLSFAMRTKCLELSCRCQG